MFENKSIALVIPCFNEETQIERVLDGVPEYVDCIIPVDDCSTDRTVEVIEEYARRECMEDRIRIVRQDRNRGPGAAVVAGYREAVRLGLDVVGVIDGDGQMDIEELPLIIGPIARGEADYVKGNRLFYRGAWNCIPRHRYLGNAFLSMLTKIASGYWHVADSQSGYTAASRQALETIDLEGVYPRYGYLNDLMVRLNIFDMRMANVHIRPVYNVGEQSKMKIWKVIPTMSWLILKRFHWRLWHKYVIRDFHPLVLFYMAAGVLALAGAGLFTRMIWLWVADGRIPPINALMWAFCMVSSAQFSLFAMWFDMEMNRDLKVRVADPDKSAVALMPRVGRSKTIRSVLEEKRTTESIDYIHVES